MINKAKFENIASGASIFLHDENWPFSDYSTEVDVRMDEEDRAGDWGVHETYTFLGKRLHHIEGDLLAQDSAEYWQRRLDFIQAITPSKSQRVFGKLRLELEGIYEETWCYCTLDGWPELPLAALSPSAGRFLVTFKSYDPRLYGSYLNEIVLDTLSTTRGRIYDKTYSYTYSFIGTSTLDAANAGNAETRPTVIVYGPATNPRIQLNSASEVEQFVQVNTVIPNGSFITIDFAETTATDSEGTDIYSSLDQGSEWWTLKPGSNEVLFLAEDASAPAKAVVRWHNAYMI
jgi:hypothetical protein